jgi:predicted ATP-grasp superfamily ATP-dependent carboligase
MSKTVLLTLGRLPKALELVRAFAQSGHRVLVAEPHPWHLCRVSNMVAKSLVVTPPLTDARAYVEGLLRIVTEEKVDLVVPVSEETMHAAALKPRLPAGVTMACMDQSVLLALHDKQRFIELAAEAGLAVPLTYGLLDAQAQGFARERKVVVKPRFSCSGRGVRFLEAGQALPVAEVTEPAIVQQFIQGDVLSTFSVARQGKVRVTSVYRGVVMSGTVSVCFERVPHPAIDQWVETFVQRTGHDGFISFDFVVDAQGKAYAIECNPRVTSGVHFVESLDLAAALLEPASATPAVRFRANTHAQQFYPTLTETQKSVFSPRFRHNLACLLRARDVVWAASDPLPFLTMPLTAWRILSHAIFKGTSLGEASTFDIEWYGEAQASPQAPAQARTG